MQFPAPLPILKGGKMAGKQGGSKRFGRNKIKCTRYYNERKLGKNKLTRFKANNIGKNWPENKVVKAISDFINLHNEKHTKHSLAK